MNQQDFIQRMHIWYQACKQHDDLQPNRLDRWRNLEPESAHFLMQLLWVKQAKMVLELGTSNGFSTAWLAYALKPLNGALSTVEIDETRSASAQQSLQALDLANAVDFIISDVRPFIAHTQQDYQVIFLDAERSEYLHYVDDLKRLLKLTAGNTLVVDNVISHAKDVTAFLACFAADELFATQTLPIGAGLFMVTYKGKVSSF